MSFMGHLLIFDEIGGKRRKTVEIDGKMKENDGNG